MVLNTPLLGSARRLCGLSACNLTPPIQPPLCCQHTWRGQAGRVLALLRTFRWLPSVLSMGTTLTAQPWCDTYLGPQLYLSPLSPWALAPQKPVLFTGTSVAFCQKASFLGLCASCCFLFTAAFTPGHQTTIS